ncbi:MAG: hypothetical protein AAF593_00380 [Planctomycetota bacterium]
MIPALTIIITAYTLTRLLGTAIEATKTWEGDVGRVIYWLAVILASLVILAMCGDVIVAGGAMPTLLP